MELFLYTYSTVHCPPNTLYLLFLNFAWILCHYHLEQKLVHLLYPQWEPQNIFVDATVLIYCHKKIMLGINLILIRSYWTWTYMHSIINFSKDTSGTPLLPFNFQYWCHSNNSIHTWWTVYLIHVFIFHSSRWSLYL